MLFTKFSNNSFFDLPWKLLGIEAVLVVLSVLLALGLNSWRQSEANEELGIRALQEVFVEAKANCSSILVQQDYHKAVVSGEQEPTGLQIGLLRNDAWDFAKSTGAGPHINHDVTALVVEINALQRDHRTMYQAYLQALFTVVLESEEQTSWHRAGEVGVIQGLLNIQTSLLEKYENLKTQVEEHYGEAIEVSSLCAEE